MNQYSIYKYVYIHLWHNIGIHLCKFNKHLIISLNNRIKNESMLKEREADNRALQLLTVKVRIKRLNVVYYLAHTLAHTF